MNEKITRNIILATALNSVSIAMLAGAQIISSVTR